MDYSKEHLNMFCDIASKHINEDDHICFWKQPVLRVCQIIIQERKMYMLAGLIFNREECIEEAKKILAQLESEGFTKKHDESNWYYCWTSPVQIAQYRMKNENNNKKNCI